MMRRRLTQKRSVLNHLKSMQSITAMEALNKYGIFRLASIIHVLRTEGQNMITLMINKPNRPHYAKYTLEEQLLLPLS